MHTEYLDLYKTYTKKYGPKTAIFLQVGSFYELYDYQNIQTGETAANVKEIVDFLGIQLSVKKGEVPDGNEGLFAGFPDYVLHKWAGRLTSTGWTVVVVDQIKDGVRGKVTQRKVSRILSPGTHIENTTSNDTPYVATLYFNVTAMHPPSIGSAILDLTTGTTITYTGQASGRPDIWTADDLVQMLSVFQPKEIIVYWNATQKPDEQFFRRIFGIPQNILIHIPAVESLGSFSKELVRSEYLQKIYNIKSVLPAKTYLGLRDTHEEIALLFLLQFVEEHYPSMLKSFHRNEPWIPQARLICGNHALTQLQMTGLNMQETVVGLFDKSITPMGKRAMRDRILSPYSSANEIRARLQEVQEYRAWPEERTKLLERQLRFMYDLPRLHRKVLCGLITPQEVSHLFQTYFALQTIMKDITPLTALKALFTQEQWSQYITVFEANFTEEKAQKAQETPANITQFNPKKYVDIGLKEKEIEEVINGFQNLRKEMAILGQVSDDAIRLEEREKEPYGLKGSTITLQQLKKNLKALPEGTKLSELKSGGWIDCTLLQTLNTRLVRLRENLSQLVKMYLMDACLEIATAGNTVWSLMEHWVCHIDCTQCIGRVSRELGFCCPTIEDVDMGSSFEIKNLRHPLVEATATRVSYVKHDISLGGLSKTGWLVYGMNASGKSTLMKATGICILLAQAGCFVPAKEMTLRPFKAVYTRILNQDNLFAGLSSFAVEMSELRDILRNANQHTLVLGDELCAGTESTSAQALVASGIQWLSKKGAKFIFATHLHDLPNILDTTSLGVEVWHLHVDYDPATKKLVYDRTLRPGSGSTLYGLEVARAMDLPFEFIEQALQNRHKIMGSTNQHGATGSTWNTSIVRRECEMCHSNITSELEVHHIDPRASATNGLLMNGTHMNDKRNLIVICQACHDKVHANVAEIGDMKITSNGPEREIRMPVIGAEAEAPQVPQENYRKSKWSTEDLKTIMDTLQKYSKMSLKSLRAYLSSKHEIEISEVMLGKMRREKYPT